jgi:hypothetical protein
LTPRADRANSRGRLAACLRRRPRVLPGAPSCWCGPDHSPSAASSVGGLGSEQHHSAARGSHSGDLRHVSAAQPAGCRAVWGAHFLTRPARRRAGAGRTDAGSRGGQPPGGSGGRHALSNEPKARRRNPKLSRRAATSEPGFVTTSHTGGAPPKDPPGWVGTDRRRHASEGSPTVFADPSPLSRSHRLAAFRCAGPHRWATPSLAAGPPTRSHHPESCRDAARSDTHSTTKRASG